jgi:hypothetical protein
MPDESALTVLIEEVDWDTLRDRKADQSLSGETVISELAAGHLAKVEELAEIPELGSTKCHKRWSCQGPTQLQTMRTEYPRRKPRQRRKLFANLRLDDCIEPPQVQALAMEGSHVLLYHCFVGSRTAAGRSRVVHL